MPTDLTPLEDAAFLMRAYADASDHWIAYRSTAATPELREATRILADALHTAADDPALFAALRELVADASEVAPVVAVGPPTAHEAAIALDPFMEWRPGGSVLRTDRILAREPEVLTAAGMSTVHAVRLATDLSRLVPDQTPMPTTVALQGLGDRVAALAGQLDRMERTLRAIDAPTAAAPPAPPRHSGWARALRTTGKGLGAVAGLAGVAGNVAGAVISFGVLSGLGLGSVLLGAKALTDSVAALAEGPVVAGGVEPPAIPG